VGQALKNVNITAVGAAGTDITTIIGGAYSNTDKAYGISVTGDGGGDVTLSSVSGFKASDLVSIDLSAAEAAELTVSGAVKNLMYTGTDEADTIKIGGAVSVSRFDVRGGVNGFTATKGYTSTGAGQALKNVNITAAGAANTDITTIIGGAYSNTAAGYGISVTGMGGGNVTLSSVSGYKVDDLLDINLGADEAATLTVSGAVKNLNYTGSAEADTIKIGGAVSDSKFALDDGVNDFAAKNAAGVGQALKNVDITGAGTKNTIYAGAYSYTNKVDVPADHGIKLTGSGANSVTLSSISGKNATDRVALEMSAGTASLTVEGLVKNLNYTGSTGDDTIKIVGSSVNDSKFVLGNGDNKFQAGTGYVSEDLTSKGATMTNVEITAGDDADTVVTGMFKSGEVDLGAGANAGHKFVG
jgi:hypothetical protein